MSDFDARRLKELEVERREILASVREGKRLLQQFEDGKRSMSRGKCMAIKQSIVNAERHSLPALTKQILQFKQRIARAK